MWDWYMVPAARSCERSLERHSTASSKGRAVWSLRVAHNAQWCQVGAEMLPGAQPEQDCVEDLQTTNCA